MNVLGVRLMVFTAVLFVWGWDDSGAVESGFSRIVRGIPRDGTGWLFAGSVGAGTWAWDCSSPPDLGPPSVTFNSRILSRRNESPLAA